MNRPGGEFYKLFGSFLLLLALPLLLFGSIYLRSVSRVEETLNAAVGESLSLEASLTDAMLREVRRSVSTFVSNDNVAAMSRVPRQPSPGERYDFTLLQSDMQSLLSTTTEIRDVCIYFPNSQSALSTNARFAPEQLEYMAATYYRSDFAAVKAALFDQPTGYHVYEAGDGGRELVYIQRLGTDRDSAVMAARMKPAALADFAEGGSARYEERRAFRLDGAVWSADLSEEIAFEPEASCPKLPGYQTFRETLDGEDSIVVGAASGAAKLDWFSTVPYRVVKQENSYILRTACLFAVLYILGGAAIAWFVARQRYSPLKKIMALISPGEDRNRDAALGEYARIEQSFSELRQRSERAEYALETTAESVRGVYLRRLLRGDANLRMADAYGVDFGGDTAFGILVLGVTDYGAQFSAAGEVDDRTSEALLYAIQNVLEESARCRSYSFSYGEQAVSVLSADNETVPAEEMERLGRSTAAFFAEKLGVTLDVKCSRVTGSPEELAAAWRELNLPLPEETPEIKPEESTIDPILRYAAEHCYENDFSLGTVAEAFGMNPSYLSRKFKSEVGAGFGEYVQNLRFERAKTLLRTTDQPVARVAEIVGYFSVSAFTAAFRKTVGMSPAAFRRGQEG